MIEEIGTVIKTSDNIALIQVNRKEACAGCSAKNFCHPFDEDDNTAEVTAINNINAEAGEKVIVAIPNKKFLKASFITYIIPVIFLLIGSFAGELIFKNDIMTFVTASLFFIVSFFIISGYSKNKTDEFLPKIIKKL